MLQARRSLKIQDAKIAKNKKKGEGLRKRVEGDEKGREGERKGGEGGKKKERGNEDDAILPSFQILATPLTTYD